ncbi:YbaB/EbfC family nucleoid-associated protein [Vagococcus lutrae]|uniref:YbaB/EbfC family nucleoid-associated protein n=1 Tax=Vagococcus lutrae TaxID=81947 RepID=UPI001C94D6B5|nr:YbaB/EbfC family nucleoid-associated protein [Vagococcus lutrae]MDO5742367.1 YbaB/EbfC family nucleoid-associated protein [Vagococcus sp.]QZN88399.1 YbaB/EbfC family nucleoid-associated protein [Vagococcus lutrae]
MMRGMGNMQGMMKQVQKMQKEMVAAQEALEKKEFEGRAANDLVVATFTGNRQLINLDINEEIIDPEDPDMLQDMILVAVNDGLSQIAIETEKTMGKYTQGMGIPGL